MRLPLTKSRGRQLARFQRACRANEDLRAHAAQIPERRGNSRGCQLPGMQWVRHFATPDQSDAFRMPRTCSPSRDLLGAAAAQESDDNERRTRLAARASIATLDASRRRVTVRQT